MLTLKLSGVVVCLCNGKQIYAKIYYSISIVKFRSVFLFVFGVECGDHKWGGPRPSSCACPGPTYVHLGPCGNQILIMKFHKIKIWKKLKLGSLRWQLKFRHNISMIKIF
jgi:hypothetical protein